MFEIIETYQFNASHKIILWDGSEGEMHNHHFNIQITAQARELNQDEITVYFNDFESDVKSVLDNFDHSYLNKMECFTGKVPSVENIAKTILKALARKLDNENLRISAVELWADPNRRVRYIAEVKNEK